MSKLIEDPKVAALVEKEVGKAVKAERKRALDAVKAVAIPEDKAHAKSVKAALKEATDGIKAAE